MNNKHNPRRGVILLVVLGMLAFLSVLVVTYVVFTSRTRQSAFAIANSEYRQPMHREMIDNAMMKLLRGTSDTNDAFYGEDLLADVYGRSGALPRVGGNVYDVIRASRDSSRPVQAIGGGFVMMPFEIPQNAAAPSGPEVAESTLLTTELSVDDFFAGMIMTFNEGPLKDHSFRILRSTGGPRTGTTPTPESLAMRFSIFFELNPDVEVVLDDGTQTTVGQLLNSGSMATRGLFYNSSNVPYRIRLNPFPLNGLGIGFDGNNLDQTVSIGTLQLPLAFQPKGAGNKHNERAVFGDFDEPYDAPDFQNFFLAHRYTDEAGNVQVIPSFHRPALINYLANEYDLSSINDQQLRQLVLAIERATFRPIPWAQMPPIASGTGDFAARPASNPRFTGGNSSFALRSPNLITDPSNHIPRLDQLLKALIQGPWDVDNDGDGIPDSVWVDLGLPLITSPEGKLLRPMVAPLIEDTGGRIHINAHGNLAQLQTTYGSAITAPWGGAPDPTINASYNPYRGLGYGPAEIFLPAATEVNASARLFSSAANRNALLQERYRQGRSPLPVFPAMPAAGDRGHDLLDRILTGTRPNIQTWSSGRGFSTDPWGRGGVGVSRSGRLYAGVSGTMLQVADTSATPPQPQIDESLNDPYEMDPSGELTGDSPYTMAEFDALMRNIDWDRDTLPDRLRNGLAASLNANPELYRLLTTRSVSLDVPPAIRPDGHRSRGSYPSGPLGPELPVPLTRLLLERLYLPFSTPTERQNARAIYPSLIGPELLLGQKLDVNRPLGNGIDDNGNGVVDEPGEVNQPAAGQLSVEQQNAAAFAHLKTGAPAAIQNTFGSVSPTYNFGATDSSGQPVSGRQLLARNLYVLMMAFSGENYAFPMRDESVVDGKFAEYRARKLAQWAVNVVDYRDSDAIMTFFPYDPTPFDGNAWDPSEFVWGVESPELIFQESLALHDVRVKDTTLENANAGNLKGPDDPSTDSIRVPQGSLFLELYNPRARIDTGSNPAPNEIAPVAAPPQELYTYDAGDNQYVLDLARMAPANPDTGGPAMPVWRIAITKRHYEGAPGYPVEMDESDPTIVAHPANDAPDESDPAELRVRFPDTAALELGVTEQLGVANAPERLGIDRVVFFRDFASITDTTNIVNELTDVTRPEQVFFNILGTDAGLLPEQYLVLAPRTTTHLGSRQYAAAGPPVGPSQQNFQILTNATYTGLFHTDTEGRGTTPNTDTQTQHALPMVIAASSDHLATANGGTWTATPGDIANRKLPQGVGLNVSEPLPGLNYYPEPNFQLDSDNDAAFPLEDAYVDYDDTTDNEVKDDPVDLANGTPILELTQVRTSDDDPSEPFLGTQERFCTAFLQRLADPTLPYQNDPALPRYNPYRSVDWISIDLTVFSGEETETTVDPPIDPEYAGGSRQRNGQDADGSSSGILYSYTTSDPPTGVETGTTGYFRINFNGLLDPTTGNYDLANAKQTFNHLNMGFGAPIVGPNRGKPAGPFALHEWLDRPFATPYEVMMVPATSQGRLFQEFTTALSANPYDPGMPGPAATSISEFKAPFGHLLNFFQAHRTENQASQFYRIFDYIDTRPPFRGELQAINPMRLQTSSGGGAVAVARNQFVNLFQPPFNVFSDYRREGEINLNTVADYPVWMGLMYGHLTNAERTGGPNDPNNPFSFLHFRTSRRGYPLPTTSTPATTAVDGTGNPQPGPYNYLPNALDPDFPTEFAGVYKPNAAAGLAPPVRAGADTLRRIGGGAQFSPVDAGLLRKGVDPTTAVADPDPLFGRRGAGTEPWRNRDRNAFFRYQTLMRMPNLVTEQSHVYMVRLTLGYFEVDASTLATGAEYKADMGQNERYRATYIIDRSVPVAYEPGADRNVRDTILYQRIAE